MCLLTLKRYYNGDRCEAEYISRERAARKNRQIYENALPPMSQRDWLIDEDDILQAVIMSDEERYSCRAFVNIESGISIIGAIACQRGHSLKSVDFRRTALEINADTLPLLGNISHETSEALREILRQNLLGDYNKHGGRGMGRSAIMADPFNQGDHVSNRFQQRVQGQARIVFNRKGHRFSGSRSF
jgi:hypothetical protein